MNIYLLTAIFCLCGYLLSSVPFSLILPLWIKGIDVRKHGSGNTGATNVFRTCGMKFAIPCFLLDGIKGFAVVFCARWFFNFQFNGRFELFILIAASCILGHVFSIFLKFKGGKGVATSLFVILALNPIGALVFAATWLSVFFIGRISSLSALLAFAALTLYSVFMLIKDKTFALAMLTLFYVVLTMFICYTHRGNIKKLLQKKELNLKNVAK